MFQSNTKSSRDLSDKPECVICCYGHKFSVNIVEPNSYYNIIKNYKQLYESHFTDL